MRQLVTIVILNLSFGTACLVGCSAEHVTAVEETDALVSDDLPVPDDPFGVCDEELICTDPAAGCGGWSDLSACSSDEACDAASYPVSCIHQCGTSADCPVPLSGDSVPVCHSGFCQLPCDAATCPNGLSCVAPIAGSGSDGYYLPQVCMREFGPEVAKFTPSGG